MIKTMEWLKKFGLRLAAEQSQSNVGDSGFSFAVDSNLGLERMVLVSVLGAIALIVMTTPIGWITGVILGIGGAVAFMFGGKDVIINWVEDNVPLPSILLNNVVLIDSKIAGLRKEMQTKLEESIGTKMKDSADKIIEELAKSVDAEIERLSIANVRT